MTTGAEEIFMSATVPYFSAPNPADPARLSHVDLMRTCAAGDKAAWEEFVTRYNRFVCLAVLRAYNQRGGRRGYAVDIDLVNDLVQDVYLKLFESMRGTLQGFRGANDAAVFVYVGRVAISVVVDHLRRSGARKRGSEVCSLDATVSDEEGREVALVDRLAAAGPTPEQEATATLLREQASAILGRSLRGRNAERDMRIAEAFIFDGCSIADIAERFDGVRESGVKSSVRRTSLRLRGEMARLERLADSYRARHAPVART
jgi:RNA polymerase sigma factor (sigma-70 family)